MKQEEHRLQVQMVKYYRYTCKPNEEWHLFAIPNGGVRDKVTGAKLKAEGVKAGVSDLFLARPTGHTDRNIYGWFVEVKVGKNKLTMSQRKFGEEMMAAGYGFVVMRDLDSWMRFLLMLTQSQEETPCEADLIHNLFQEESERKRSSYSYS